MGYLTGQQFSSKKTLYLFQWCCDKPILRVGSLKVKVIFKSYFHKLINFEYFLRKGILTENQYQDLLKLIKENLRIANGYLLFYRKQYYDSLRQKTAYLANLDAMIDNYFAHFEDGIISHYQNGEAISNFIGIDKASSLTEAALKEIYYRADDSTIPMISADVTIGSTMTSYFNAQQNFLKNIYLFRKF